MRKINLLYLEVGGKVEGQAGIFGAWDEPTFVYFSLLWFNFVGRLMKASLILGC